MKLRDDLPSDPLDDGRVLDPADAGDDVLGAGVTELAEALDELTRGLAPAPAVCAEVDRLERRPRRRS